MVREKVKELDSYFKKKNHTIRQKVRTRFLLLKNHMDKAKGKELDSYLKKITW